MTSFGHVLAVISASLLCCSFAVTAEAIMRVKLSKPMLGDCSINRRLTSTKRMTNDAADFWKLPKSSVVICDTERCALRMVSRLSGYPRRIYKPVWNPSCIRHVIQWPHARDNGVTEPVNGRIKEEFRELCKGGAQNATVCKVRSCSTVMVGKIYYSVRWLLKMVSISRVITLEGLTMASWPTETAG